jgi:hypothetical protein
VKQSIGRRTVKVKKDSLFLIFPLVSFVVFPSTYLLLVYFGLFSFDTEILKILVGVGFVLLLGMFLMFGYMTRAKFLLLRDGIEVEGTITDCKSGGDTISVQVQFAYPDAMRRVWMKQMFVGKITEVGQTVRLFVDRTDPNNVVIYDEVDLEVVDDSAA